MLRVAFRARQTHYSGQTGCSHATTISRVYEASVQAPSCTRTSSCLCCVLDTDIFAESAPGHACENRRDCSSYAETAVPEGERLVPASIHWQCAMANRRHYGWVCRPWSKLRSEAHRSKHSIHERSAREKISADQVAHVLNDEVSRKYIQSLKRSVLKQSYIEVILNHCMYGQQNFNICANQVPAR